MKVTYLGHSAVHVATSGGRILIDPFLTGNPLAAAAPGDVAADLIVVTHGHADHVGDAASISELTGAKVVSSPEICGWLEQRGAETHGMNIGGPYTFPAASISFTPAWHSSALPDGTYGGMPMGVVLEHEGKRLYHAGDTALFSDMQLIGRGGLAAALLPIGGNFTMDPAQALDAVRFLQPDIVIPVHYDTFPVIRQDAHAFARLVEAETSSRCVVLAPGESVDI